MDQVTSGLPDRYNLADDFVDRHVREGRGAKVAIACESRTLTYSQLAEQVNQAGNALIALGIQEEQRVMVLLPDIPEFAVAYFAAMKIGAVAVPTSTALRAADYAYFLDESRARALIIHSSIYEQASPALANRKYLRHVIGCGDRVEGLCSWEDWLWASSPVLQAAETAGDDAAFWLWTSGSTGHPKAAVHLHKDWAHCCTNYARGILGIRADDITFSASKLFHAYGLGNGLMFPFHAGASTVMYSGKPHATAVLKTVQDMKPTLFFSVPTLYAAMLQESDQRHYDISSVRLAVSAAEPLPAEIFRRWKQRFGIEILDGIGSTEVLHIYISASPGCVKPGSSGQPVPGYDVRILDSDGLEAPAGCIGDLWVRGPSTSPGYWKRPALTRARMRGDWFVTGDKYYVDEDGYYWYAGRSDDIFRVSGQWVSPNEVESTLMEHGVVVEAAVVAFEEETRLLTPKAFVVLKKGVPGTAELVRELQEFVKQRITPYKYPRRIEFLPELPKSAAGKVLRYKLRNKQS
ncbi:MAG TPA: benzoate-CoA ligase family protein [Terriglobia bacterium]|jgi:benzoate-CoA ligase